MQCPVCDVTLSISAREGVEIDFCPQCRGVWLDRGELDKIIDRAGAIVASLRQPKPPPRPEPAYEDRGRRPRDDRDRDDRDRDRDDRDRRDDRRRKRKKKGFDFLEDLFDFD